METAARGASEEGGTTVGILPGESADEANPFVQIKVVTGMGHSRNVVVARSADVLVAVGGSLGTLSEIALGLKSGTPVVVLETGSDSEAERAARTLEHEDIFFASAPVRAVELALSPAD